MLTVPVQTFAKSTSSPPCRCCLPHCSYLESVPSGFCDSAGPTSAWYECDAAAPGNVVVYAYSKVGNCTGKWDKKIHNTTRYALN